MSRNLNKLTTSPMAFPQFPRISDNSPALFASYGLRILCCNALNLGAMGGFTVAGIACDHTIII